MMLWSKRIGEIFIILIFGVTALSTVVGVENADGGSIVKLGFPFVFYEQACVDAACSYDFNFLMIVPDVVLYFIIAVGFVNFSEQRKQKKAAAASPIITSKPAAKKPLFGFLKRRKSVQKKAPEGTTFFGGSQGQPAKKPISEQGFELIKGEEAEEEPLFDKDELEDTNEEDEKHG